MPTINLATERKKKQLKKHVKIPVSKKDFDIDQYCEGPEYLYSVNEGEYVEKFNPFDDTLQRDRDERR